MAEDLDQQPQLALGGVGARLTAAREAAGLSRADIAARTKIPERHLIAIEAGDFGALASRTYAIGFSRTYARAVGLDEKEMAAAVRAELGDDDPLEDARAATFEPGDPSRVPSRATAWLAALAAFVVILAGFALWRSYYVPAMSLPSLVSDAPAEAVGAGAASQPAAAAAAATPQGPVAFTATQAGIWVRFYDAAGTRLLEKELAQGESYTVPAEAQGPMLWTARPDALQVSIGGQPVPPLADRQITMKDVPVSAAALLARGAPAPVASAVPTAAAPPSAAGPAMARSSAARPQPRRPRPAATASPVPAAVATPDIAPPPPAAPVAASTDSE